LFASRQSRRRGHSIPPDFLTNPFRSRLHGRHFHSDQHTIGGVSPPPAFPLFIMTEKSSRQTLGCHSASSCRGHIPKAHAWGAHYRRHTLVTGGTRSSCPLLGGTCLSCPFGGTRLSCPPEKGTKKRAPWPRTGRPVSDDKKRCRREIFTFLTAAVTPGEITDRSVLRRTPDGAR